MSETPVAPAAGAAQDLDGNRGLGLLLAAAAYTCWGLLAPVGKILLQDLPPMGLNVMRFVIVMAILAVMWPKSLVPAVRLLADWRYLGLMLLVPLQFASYMYALERTAATFAVLGFFTSPFWTALFAWKTERRGAWFLPALAALFVGGYLAMGGGNAAGFDLIGVLLGVATGIGWAAYSVGLRHYRSVPHQELTIGTFVVMLLFFLIAAMIEGQGFVPSTNASWGWLLVYALIPTLAALWLFTRALANAPAGDVNMLVGLEVAGTVLFSAWLLGDRFTVLQFAGIALVLVAVTGYLASLREQS